jgi:hypothetical protein
LLASCEASGRRKWDTTRLAAPTFFPTLGSGFPVPHLGGSALPVPSSAYALHLRSAHTSLWDALAATLSRLSGSRHSFLAKLVRPSLVPLFPSSSRWLYLTTSLLPGQFSVQKSLAQFNHNVTIELGRNAMQAVIYCKNPACGKELPIQEAPITTRGHRKRAYCNDACKQAYYRYSQQQKRSDGEQALLKDLEEASARIAALEQHIASLKYQLDLEKRFYEDTKNRAFKSWLRKQAPSPLGSRFLADQLFPPRGSRAFYTAYLRKQQYSPDEIHELEHLWKMMLLSQS